MSKAEIRRPSWRWLAPAMLTACLYVVAVYHGPLVQATTCDQTFGTNVYVCTNVNGGIYEDCYNTNVNTYNLCVLQNGPIGVTPLQPITAPPRPGGGASLRASILRNCLNGGNIPIFL